MRPGAVATESPDPRLALLATRRGRRGRDGGGSCLWAQLGWPWAGPQLPSKWGSSTRRFPVPLSFSYGPSFSLQLMIVGIDNSGHFRAASLPQAPTDL